MLPETAFPQFVPARNSNSKTLERVKARTWHELPNPVRVFQTRPTKEHCRFQEGTARRFEPVAKTPLYWRRASEKCW